MVYFIREWTTNFIKIGFTEGSVEHRVSQIQTCCPGRIELLATMEGGKGEERELHDRFSEARKRGEWFEDVYELTEFIEEIKENQTVGVFYIVATDEIKPLADRVIQRWHERLNKAGVTIGYLFAHSDRDAAGNPKGPAIKGHGYPAAAQARIVGLRDRVAGLPDALIILDGDQWPDWIDKRREAVLDHELTHLHPTGDTDDANRPKLEMRLHDIQIGGFLEVIQRHEEQAIEHELLVGAGKAVRELTGKAWG